MYPDKLTDNMRKKGYEVIFFKTKEEATQYICGLFDGAVIGCGDSQTISKMDLYRLLSAKNTVFGSWIFGTVAHKMSHNRLSSEK